MKKTILLLFVLTSTSCASLFLNTALEKMGVFDEKPELQLLENNDKKVLFMGMHHLGRKEFYNDVAFKVDSLQNIGFVVYYELVKNNSIKDSIKKVNYYKKARKITGVKTAVYYDTITKKIAGKFKYKGDYKLISQPSYKKLEVNMEIAKNADVEINKLIDEFEKKYGEIKLNECDVNNPVYSKKYDCELLDKELREKFKKEFMEKYRNQNLALEISNSKHKKILIIYGKNHFDGLKNELKKIDKKWNTTIANN